MKCEFLCAKGGIHSDHARINLQPSRNPGCYQYQTQLLKLSTGPVYTSNVSVCAQNAEFIQIMRGLTSSRLKTRDVTSTKRNF